MKTTSILLIVLFSFLVLSCGPGLVKKGYDPDFDFNQFKTFRIIQSQSKDDGLQKAPLLYEVFAREILRHLDSKGFDYIKDTKADVDFTVVLHTLPFGKMRVFDHRPGATYKTGYRGWYSPWWGPFGDGIDVDTYEPGTLVIDVVDNSDNVMVWRGMVREAVQDYDNINEAEEGAWKYINEVMPLFPPKK